MEFMQVLYVYGDKPANNLYRLNLDEVIIEKIIPMQEDDEWYIDYRQ